MAFELVYENSYNLVPFLALLISLLVMIIFLKIREKIKRQIVVAFSLIVTCIASLTVALLFSEYTLDVMHILSHVTFSVILLISAKLLLTEKVPAFFHLLILLELNVFDRFQYVLAQKVTSFFNRIRDLLELSIFNRSQYVLAQKVTSFAKDIRRTQTGDLNFNMIGVVIGLIICLSLLLSSLIHS